MERRSFIKQAAVITSAAMFSTHKLFHSNDIIGQNEKRYRLDKS